MQYTQYALFLIPLGAIGVWRWIVWLIKRCVALFYRQPEGAVPGGSFSIVTPVYNENPEIFRKALQSWIIQGNPDEIIAVIDYSDTRCIDVFQEYMLHDKRFTMIITDVPGKRPALADGVRETQCDFVALVDSDTIWKDPMRSEVLRAFSDPKVGGITTRQDVLNPNTLSKKLFQMHLSNRYLSEMPFLAAAGDALTCLSGRTAIYRRTAILPHLDELVHETFLGQQVISGDDKTLTRLVQSQGWKVKYFRDTTVLTPGFDRMYPFLKQLIRWNRNSWRSDLQSIGSRWLWQRNKVLGLYMLDRFIQPFTLLLGIIYFFVALIFGYWQISVGLALWWLVSRSIKIAPHLRQYPKDIVIVPAYIIFSYVTAIIKIYALFTLNLQGWITRWDTNRLHKQMWQKIPAYALTAAVIGTYVFGISTYEYRTLQTSGSKMRQSIFSSGPKTLATEVLEQKRGETLENIKNQGDGAYLVGRKDTLTSIQKKYHVDSLDAIIKANEKNIKNQNMLNTGQQISIPTAELKNIPNADELLKTKAMRRPPLVRYDKPSNTIFVRSSGSIVTLSQINNQLRNKALLEETAKGEWLLKANINISKNVTFIIDDSDAKILKLKSDSNGFVWVKSQGGNVVISQTKIISWDEAAQGPDTNLDDGRSFIVAKGGGRMDVVKSEISHLGSVGVGKRGGEFGGSYGLSWKLAKVNLNQNLLTGSVTDSDIHDNFFGMYTYGVTGVIVQNNSFHDNVGYGIDPHDDSNNMIVADNKVYNNGYHGIIFSKRCRNNVVINNESYNNKYHGIMLHADSNNNIIENNVVFGNTDGIAVYASSRNYIANNDVRNNKQGIRLSHGSSENYVEKNSFIANRTGMHLYNDANNNYLMQNSVREGNLGVSIQRASGNYIYDNLKAAENIKDGNIDSLQGNEIK